MPQLSPAIAESRHAITQSPNNITQSPNAIAQSPLTRFNHPIAQSPIHAMTVKLTIAYDGTEFAGWQRQARERTV
jgi:hypothetical protein